jgi:nicotinate-nucleotide adenylyltransferase
VSLVDPQKLGILGGTFDPPHLGHLILAQSAYEQLGLDKVIFIPAAMQPFKVGRDISSAQIRYKMLELAIGGDDRFALSDIEIKRPGLSYTIDTIEELKKIYAATQMFLIIGSDIIGDMSAWKEPEKIFAACAVAMAIRPDTKLSSQYGDKIKPLTMPQVGISSTEIRQKIKDGRTIKYLVPETVERYIYQNHLYQ